ncbi:ligand-binding sensor domain-containing protein, partial [Cognatilysobacter lacus]
MRTLAALMLLLALVLAPRARALEPDKAFRHYVSDSWSIQQGLPQISVLSLAQDRTGYIWVGTQSGLARFDGLGFRTYTPENTPGLPGTWVRSLLSARDGRLWVGTYKGLAFFDGHEFSSVPAPAGAPALDVLDITEDSQGRIWLATPSGVFRVEHDRLLPVAGSPLPAQAVLVRDDGLWVGTRGAVYRRLATGRWERL